MSKEKLSTKVGKVKLRNPTMLAAGILGLTGASLKRVWESGAGGIVAKSVGTKPRKGYPGPNVVQTPCGIVNAMGLPNPGIEEALREIEIVKKYGATIVGSVFSKRLDDLSSLAKQMGEAGVDAVELNLSCPHAEEVSLIGHEPDLAKEAVEFSKDCQTPLWAKLPGNTHLSNLLEVAKSVEEAGADAIVVTNTLPAIVIDTTSKRPILGNKTGGLSGPAIKPIGLRLVYEIYQTVDIPIIGTGGIMDGQDMIEYILAGASAVEIGTGIMWKDLEIFRDICEEAQSILGNRNVEDLIGSAHEV